MKFLRSLKRIFSDRPDRGLVKVFRAAYGRDPTADEATALGQLSSFTSGDQAAAFRAVIGRFDRQVLNTPFAVKLARSDIAFVSVEGVSLAVDTTDASVGAELLNRGSYEPHLVQFFKDRVRPGMTVIDVGANIGYHSMLAARLVGGSGKVFCFEPNSENCRLILLGARRNRFDNLRVYPVAASDRMGYSLFTTHVGSNGGLLPTTEEALLCPSCAVVPTFRLDDLIQERVDVIKIDTEGAEGLVIGGARRLLEAYRPTVISEFSMEMLPRVSGMSGNDYLLFFRKLGYNLYVIDRRKSDLQPIPDVPDFLRNYGTVTRIEDLAFIPREMPGDVRQ
jgi:FkbM family methyltransferase